MVPSYKLPIDYQIDIDPRYPVQQSIAEHIHSFVFHDNSRTQFTIFCLLDDSDDSPIPQPKFTSH